jgi:hypothetical protein
MARESDPGLETLLELDGELVVLENGMWVKFVAHRIEADDRRPRGIAYSLTLHDRRGMRVFGIDNAHGVRRSAGPAGGRGKATDHMHHGNVVRPYEYRDAAGLLADFWDGVDAVLRSGGRDD